MLRFVTFFVVLLASSGDDQNQFLLKRAEKVLLDPKSPRERFDDEIARCVLLKDIVPVLAKAAEVYRKDKDSEESRRRFGECFSTAAVMCSRRPNDFPESLLQDMFSLLTPPKGLPQLITVDFVGKLGKRGKPALPVLRKLQDVDDREIALAAFQAVKAIEKSLK